MLHRMFASKEVYKLYKYCSITPPRKICNDKCILISLMCVRPIQMASAQNVVPHINMHNILIQKCQQDINCLFSSPDYHNKAIKDVETVANIPHRTIGNYLKNHLQGKETGEYQVTDLNGLCKLIRLCGESGERRDRGVKSLYWHINDH